MGRMTNVTMDLVLQAPAIGASDLGAIAALAGAQGIHALPGASHQAFRLPRAQPNAGIAELCAKTGVDMAFVSSDLTRDRVRVVAMDMDSTLITIECAHAYQMCAVDQRENSFDRVGRGGSLYSKRCH
jgi:hypothetical protein